MSQTSTKNWINKSSAKLVTFPSGGELINLDFHLETLLNTVKADPKGYIRITLSKKAEPDRFGNQYSIYENDFVPTKQDKAPEAVAPKVSVKKDSPFHG